MILIAKEIVCYNHLANDNQRNNILISRVSLDIIYGLKALSSGGDLFACKLFERDDEAWSNFYHQNLYSLGFNTFHTFDIVIGQSCLSSENTCIFVLKIGSIKPTQIAPCIQKACAWLESCAKGLI